MSEDHSVRLFNERIESCMRDLSARIEHDLWGPPYIAYDAYAGKPEWKRRLLRAKSRVLVFVNNVRFWLARKLWNGCTCEHEE